MYSSYFHNSRDRVENKVFCSVLYILGWCKTPRGRTFASQYDSHELFHDINAHIAKCRDFQRWTATMSEEGQRLNWLNDGKQKQPRSQKQGNCRQGNNNVGRPAWMITSLHKPGLHMISVVLSILSCCSLAPLSYIDSLLGWVRSCLASLTFVVSDCLCSAVSTSLRSCLY